MKTYLCSVTDLSSLTVLRTILRSHDEAQKSHGKQIHKLMEYTSRIFSFLPCKIDFQASILYKSTVLRHICRINWLSCGQDTDLKTMFRRQMPNEVIVTSLSHLDLSRYVSSTLSKWRETINIHWAKTKFKTEWEGSYPVTWILSNRFSFLSVSYTWF